MCAGALLPLVLQPTYVYATCMADELIGTMGSIKAVATTVWCNVASQWEKGGLWH